jgi:hypothetical protein
MCRRSSPGEKVCAGPAKRGLRRARQAGRRKYICHQIVGPKKAGEDAPRESQSVRVKEPERSARTLKAGAAARKASMLDAAQRRRSYAQGAGEYANKMGWAVQARFSESGYAPPGEGTAGMLKKSG